jgi:7-carboxy-7-deazaguanine synthase
MRISEIFYSLQGEGVLTGVPSVFIRTAGCNLACPWCDTRHAWSREGAAEWSVEALLGVVARWPQARHCVVTGGEPTLEPELPELTRRLHAAGLHITIETNATRQPSPGLICDLASLSPKLGNTGPGALPVSTDILRAWLRRGEHQLKLVCAGAGDLPDILALQTALAGDLATGRLLLMPLTLPDPDASRRCREAVVQLCLENGFRYATRLHLDLFGGRRGA